jgi:hypothetical protein
MPLQHLFTKREQRIIAGVAKEQLVQTSTAYWGQKGYRINFWGPYQLHGENIESRLGLRQVIDLNITDFNQNVAIDLSLSATLGDTEAVVGAVGLVLIPLAAVVVGGLSYIDYDQRAIESIGGYWNTIFATSGPGQPQQVVPLKCRSCGVLLEIDAKFCKNCGAKVE